MAARRTNMKLDLRDLERVISERDDLARQLGDITAVVAASKHLPQRDTIAETILAADDRIAALASPSSHPIAEVVGEEFKALASHVGIGKRYEEASRQRVTPMSPRALASIIKDWCYRRAKWEAAQARQETLREVAKAMGLSEPFDALTEAARPVNVTADALAAMIRLCMQIEPEEVARQFRSSVKRWQPRPEPEPTATFTIEPAGKYADGFDQVGVTGVYSRHTPPVIEYSISVTDSFAGIMDGPEMMPLGDDEGDQ